MDTLPLLLKTAGVVAGHSLQGCQSLPLPLDLLVCDGGKRETHKNAGTGELCVRDEIQCKLEC